MNFIKKNQVDKKFKFTVIIYCHVLLQYMNGSFKRKFCQKLNIMMRSDLPVDNVFFANFYVAFNGFKKTIKF